jgi:penicillin-binding protein 1A
MNDRRIPTSWRWAGRIGGALLGLLLVSAVAAGIAGYAAYRHYAAGLPGVDGLKSYNPPVMSRVYAADGSLMAELATERRIFAPLSDIPKLVQGAFIAAEDQSFWTNPGIDPAAIVRAGVTDLTKLRSGRRPIGASTITQQVARNMLLGSDKLTLDRKIREALLAMRLTTALGKARVLELYLNQIYLGEQSYGVAAAAQTYFGATLDQLTPAQAAFLAALPKAPNNYNPYHDPDAARARRDWVLDRMADLNVITPAQAAAGKQAPLIPPDFTRPELKQTDTYFAEDVRRQLVAQFGGKAVVEDGLTIRTSLDPHLQQAATAILRQGLIAYDEAHEGWRGPVTHIEPGADWPHALASVVAPPGMLPDWTLGVVLSVGATAADLGVLGTPAQGAPAASAPRHVSLALADMAWARPARDGGLGTRPRRMDQVVRPGDVVMVEARADGAALLRQIPAIEGGLVTLDPRTGRIEALVGGWSFQQSQFDRVTQASRQPGSSFKPFVYLTAMEQNILPTQTFLDAPFLLNTPQGQWRPNDYEAGYLGPVTLRTALEKSLNLVTIRVADRVGMDNVANTAVAFHVVDSMPHYLPGAIGAIDTTILRMAGAYAGLDEDGREVLPSLIDSVQDRNGMTLYRATPVGCQGCDGTDPNTPPEVVDTRRQVADAASVFQVVQMMKGVVERGTGKPAQIPGRVIAGKTGTTQDFNDAWFIGFTPDCVTAVWLGYDTPRDLGEGDTGGKIAAPVWRDFMVDALKDRPVLDFVPPQGMYMVADPAGGMDAFKANEDPFAPVTLMSDNHDAAVAPPAPGTAAAGAAAVDTNLGGVY